ncbi:MAG: GAF domain-containing protein [Fulvivirga sp.]|nr:GAF domain-containing protein [Fulvivirga sp.]
MANSIRTFFSEYAVTIGITIVALLIAHNAIVSFISQNAIHDRNEVEEVQLTVNELIDTHGTMVNLMDLGLRGYYMMREEKFIDPYNIAMNQYESNLDTLQTIMKRLDYPHLDSIQFVKEAVSDYAELVGQGIDYIKNGQPEEAIALFETDPGLTLWNTYNPILQNVSGYVNQLNKKSKENYEQITSYSVVSQLVTVMLGIPVLIIVLVRLIRQEKRIIKLFDDLEESKQRYIYKEETNNKRKNILDKGMVINDMIENLKKASQFIQNISSGNLSAKWEGMTEEVKKENKNTIAGELIEMRDQLKNVKEEDKKRQWITEGVAKFADLIRENKDDFDKLSNEVISYIVNYTESNQGGLYLLNEDDPDEPYIELVSCYAYDKHKFVEKRIEMGEGLLGQTFLEGETAILKDLPEDYINITSGVGEALPRNLIIVPIMMDEKCQGVIELATFGEYGDQHTAFLERISLSLGSEIVSIKSSKLTKELFEKSKENQEQMRQQEEEMRQNMEEMQATQEEQDRLRRELEAKIEELEKELEQNQS